MPPGQPTFSPLCFRRLKLACCQFSFEMILHNFSTPEKAFFLFYLILLLSLHLLLRTLFRRRNKTTSSCFSQLDLSARSSECRQHQERIEALQSSSSRTIDVLERKIKGCQVRVLHGPDFGRALIVYNWPFATDLQMLVWIHSMGRS